MIHSLLQILIFQLLFLAVYDLLLKKESFFGLNRAYLLLTPLLCLALPFISLGFIQQNIPEGYLMQMPAVMLGEVSSGAGKNSITWLLTLKSIYILGVVISSFVFFFKVYKILKLRSAGVSGSFEGVDFRILPNTDAAFSFFNTIYLGEKISEKNKKNIIAHEKVHIKQKHSLDLVYFELLRIVFWFNPLVYLFQNRLSILHEYMADAGVTKHNSKKQYYQNLLSEVFKTSEISFVSSFYKQSTIKNRIIMLQKSKSPKVKLMKYLVLLPILGIILTYTSCSDTTENLQQNEQQITNQDLLPPAPPPPPAHPLPPPPPPPPSQKSDGENVGVLFSVIEKVPVYPGCTGDNLSMKTCMSTKIAEFVNSNFNTELANDLALSGRQRISVQFTIDKTGKVAEVRARAPHPKLEAEAIRVVKMFPRMEPGEQKGEKVGVLYSLPIVFDVQE